MVVFGDLSIIVAQYARLRPHDWIASVRERRPYFIGLVRTRLDEHYINAADDLVRNSEMRATLCGNLDTDLPRCLLKASSALEPHALNDVRYSSPTHRLWVQFNDGLFGFISWSRLDLQREAPYLILQTAMLRDNGAAIEIVGRNGDLLRIEASSLRKAVAATQFGISRTGVGNRVRSARSEAGMSQSDLARKTGIPQGNISRIETGSHSPRLHTLKRLAGALECELAELLSQE
jgi:DNA-binding XRE family transcriptional regulator